MSENNGEVIVTLVDEQGAETKFDHIMTFEHLNEHYIALMPVDDVEGIGDDEVLILHIVEKDGKEQYENIDNDLLLDEVFDTFLQLLEEEED